MHAALSQEDIILVIFPYLAPKSYYKRISRVQDVVLELFATHAVIVAPYRKFTTLLCGIDDILFTWSSNTKTSTPARTLKALMTLPTWRLYERELYTQDECYHQLSQDFPPYDPAEIERAIDQARDSLISNDNMIALLRQFKSESSGQLRILAISNISKPDYAFLRTKPTDCSVSDDVYKSSDAGQRKPNLGFYRYVVDGAALDSYSTVYIDDKLENVLDARSLGMHDSSAIIKGRSLVDLPEQAPRKWNFFASKPVLMTEEFPEDLDTTSLGLTAFETDEDVVQSVMNEMLEYVNPDSIVMTYFDHNRPRFDPVVCVNVLLNRAYLEGTRYYVSAECFLYFLSRLLRKTNDPELRDLFYDPLKERVQERIGVEGDALALAMRILTCATVGVRDDVDMRTLLLLQCEDGGWKMGWIYKYGSSDVTIGNRGLATAFAMTAIKAMEEIPLVAPTSQMATPVKLPEGPPRRVKPSSSRLSLVRHRFTSWLSHSIMRSHALKTNF
ncbi:hypothetical protein NEOLEDRAFT_1241644 [Neolentinus lepideus HHB14362 ss-1]|uniref:HAD-like protein n=1 Tax=Neolentinus lepideus HHB14362 ss-1 TaxID=1314782 RepID=A0A165SWZ6_9AGAM|nr:hypothetical protein NEOLEDRAFT_1241644 [Neolentinus lepideus HHB14362 ss-1]